MPAWNGPFGTPPQLRATMKAAQDAKTSARQKGAVKAAKTRKSRQSKPKVAPKKGVAAGKKGGKQTDKQPKEAKIGMQTCMRVVEKWAKEKHQHCLGCVTIWGPNGTTCAPR